MKWKKCISFHTNTRDAQRNNYASYLPPSEVPCTDGLEAFGPQWSYLHLYLHLYLTSISLFLWKCELVKSPERGPLWFYWAWSLYQRFWKTMKLLSKASFLTNIAEDKGQIKGHMIGGWEGEKEIGRRKKWGNSVRMWKQEYVGSLPYNWAQPANRHHAAGPRFSYREASRGRKVNWI